MRNAAETKFADFFEKHGFRKHGAPGSDAGRLMRFPIFGSTWSFQEHGESNVHVICTDERGYNWQKSGAMSEVELRQAGFVPLDEIAPRAKEGTWRPPAPRP